MSQRRRDHVALALLAAMLSLPFLLPWHTTPIPSFHAEWLAGALGLAAWICLVGAGRVPVPGLTVVAGLLAAWVLLQLFVERAPVPPLSRLTIIYLVWAMGLAMVGRRLADSYGLGIVARVLAWALLVAAAIGAATSLVSVWLPAGAGVIFPPRSGGLLAQANHFSSFLWLGLASAAYLRSIDALPRSLFWLLAVLLAATAMLVGQRSSLVYAAALAGVFLWQSRRAGHVTLRRPALQIAALFLVLQPVAWVLPDSLNTWIAPPPALRAARELTQPSIRLQLLRIAAESAAQAPLLGVGIGGYAAQSIRMAEIITPADNPGPTEHAHNLPAQLAAELGLPAAIVVIFAALLWLRRLPLRGEPPEAGWAGAVVGIIVLHSLLEYPLWHSYFLGPLAVIAGAAGGRGLAAAKPLASVRAASAICLGAMLWGAISLMELRRDYALLEQALALGGNPLTLPAATAALLQIRGDSALMPWVNTTACVSLDPLSVPVNDGLAVCRKAMVFAPTTEAASRTAILLWRSGDIEAAQKLVRSMDLASRNFASGALKGTLLNYAAREPRLAGLAGFATAAASAR